MALGRRRLGLDYGGNANSRHGGPLCKCRCSRQLPSEGEVFQRIKGSWRFEVFDMDAAASNKLLVTNEKGEAAE